MSSTNDNPDRTINNQASNYGPQGVFNAPVTIHHPQPTPPPPAFQVPYPQSMLFVGRQHELERLAALLDSGETIAVVPAIAGTGGIGKTMLAAEFAHRYRERFPGGVFWLNMEDPEGITSQVAACAGPSGLQLAGYTNWNFEQQIAATRAAWQQMDRRLLIFDNLEDPTLLSWRPAGGGSRVLITTRWARWTAHSGVRAIPLDTLARPDSLCLLLTPRYSSNFPDDPTADAICEALGDLPLALALAGAYLEHYPSLSLKDYATQITSNPVMHESLNAVLEEGLPTSHASSIVTTFTLSYNQLQTDDPIDALARTLLHRAAYCAPVAIPRPLLAYINEAEQEAIVYQQKVDKALHRLLTVGLLDDLNNAGVRLHRLLAAFVRSILFDLKEQQWLTQTLATILDKINKDGDPRKGLPYLEHARQVVGTTEDAANAMLLNSLGMLLRTQGNRAAALPYLKQALDICERTFGPNHRYTATSLNNLGTLLRIQGDLDGARPYLERALAIREHLLGNEHPDTAQSLNNLGVLVRDMGDLVNARRCHEQALAIRKKVLGDKDPATAQSLNNLGLILQKIGDLAGAHPYLKQALEIRKQTLGPNHTDTARSWNNLGTLLQKMGDLVGARPYLERALEIHQQVLGPNHPDTATSLNNLGYLLQAMGDLAGAQLYFQRTLDIWERTLGPKHPNTKAIHRHLLALASIQHPA